MNEQDQQKQQEHQEQQQMRIGQMVIEIDDMEKQVLVRMGDLRAVARKLRILSDCVDPDNGDSCLAKSGNQWKITHPDFDEGPGDSITDLPTLADALVITSEVADLQFRIENAKSGLRSELNYRYGQSQKQ